MVDHDQNAGEHRLVRIMFLVAITGVIASLILPFVMK